MPESIVISPYENYNVGWKRCENIMSKQNIVSFAPGTVKKKRSIPRIVIPGIFICIAAFLISVFVILSVNDFDINKALGAREETKPSEETTTENAENGILADMQAFKESLTFLILCSDGDELTFCQLAGVDIAGRKVRIKPLPTDYVVTLPSGESTVEEVFRKESLSVLAASFASRNINIKKYIHVTEDNFRRLLSNLGPVSVEVAGNYEFNIDAVKYTFVPGEQNMAPDTLIKYMKNSETGESALRLQANASAAVFRQHFTKDNLNKGESFFSTLINLVDTNITAFDYNGALPVLSALLSDAVEIAVVS